MSEWYEMIDDRDAKGNLTPLALALVALEDNGCDCGTDEPGTCLAHLCEAALRAQWERERSFLVWLDAEIEAARQLNRQDPIATRSALERVKARLVG